MRCALLASLLLVGCGGGDPCDGLQTCISLRVEGNVGPLDQLRIHIDNVGDMFSPMPAGAQFNLPVRLAVVVGNQPSVSLSVQGLLAGTLVADAPAQNITLAAGNPSARDTFTLFPLGGGGDGGGGMDGPPPGVVSFNPPLLDFGSLQRGGMSPNQTTHLVNLTGHAVHGTGMATMTMVDVFNIISAPCLSGPMGMDVTLDVGQTCDLTFQFVPTVSGVYQQDVTVAFDDGENIGFTMKGTGLKTWSSESITAGNPNLNAVWGADSTHWYAAGTGVFNSSGTGQWNIFNNGNTVAGVMWSMFGLDSGHIWVAGDSGAIYRSDGSPSWATESMSGAFAGSVRGLWYRDASTGFGAEAAGSAGQVLQGFSGAWSAVLVSPSANPLFAMCGSGQRNVAVGGGGQYGYTPAMGGTWTVNVAIESGYNGALHGCWMSDANTFWAVGDGPKIFRCTANGTGGWDCSEQAVPSTVTQNPSAIAGRIVPGSMPEIFVVGTFGNKILHTIDGGATWTADTLPNNQGMSAVWVTPSGDVMAVGFAGQINHFY
jgi:hypothetical protein